MSVNASELCSCESVYVCEYVRIRIIAIHLSKHGPRGSYKRCWIHLIAYLLAKHILQRRHQTICCKRVSNIIILITNTFKVIFFFSRNILKRFVAIINVKNTDSENVYTVSLECISSSPIIPSQPTSIPPPTLHLFFH